MNFQYICTAVFERTDRLTNKQNERNNCFTPYSNTKVWPKVEDWNSETIFY